MRAQPRDHRHRALEVLARDGLGGLVLGGMDGGGEFALFGLEIELRVGPTVIRAAVLFLFDAQNIRGTLGAGEQARAVLGAKEFAERLDAADDEEQIVASFALSREHRVDEIVTRALIAEL